LNLATFGPDSHVVFVPSHAPDDFNSDSRSDILLQNTSGQTAIWELDGTGIIGAGFAGAPGADWLVV